MRDSFFYWTATALGICIGVQIMCLVNISRKQTTPTVILNPKVKTFASKHEYVSYEEIYSKLGKPKIELYYSDGNTSSTAKGAAALELLEAIK